MESQNRILPSISIWGIWLVAGIVGTAGSSGPSQRSGPVTGFFQANATILAGVRMSEDAKRTGLSASRFQKIPLFGLELDLRSVLLVD